MWWTRCTRETCLGETRDGLSNLGWGLLFCALRMLRQTKFAMKNMRWNLLRAGRARPQVFIARCFFVCPVFWRIAGEG